MKKVTSWLLKHRYAALSAALCGLMLRQTMCGQWVGDFWEHSAVVRELATHPLHPRHPQLLLDAPHAFVSPYSLGVGLLARALHGDAVLALSVVGMVNVVLFLAGLRFFVSGAVPERRPETAFYTLLLTLLGWGAGVWYFSGFYHLGVLGYVLPYPSTFSVALTLIALGLNQRRIETGTRLGLVSVFLLAVIVLISHPITFFLFAAGLVAQACAAVDAFRRQVAIAGCLLVLAFAVAACWPYFPVLKLFLGESRVYDHANLVMYQQVLARAWPALLGVPLLVAALWRNRRQPLGLMFVPLAGLYVFGGITGRYSYGRALPQMVLLLHLTLAEHLARLEARVAETDGPRWYRRLLVPVAVAAVALYLGWPLVQMARSLSSGSLPPTSQAYQFLPRFVGQYEVVLADRLTAGPVPTFGGKIVAAHHTLAFVPDHETRKADVGRFFGGTATPAERDEIVRKYAVDHLLLRKADDTKWQALRDEFLPRGRLAYEDDRFVLLSLVRARRGAAPPGGGRRVG